MRMACVLTVAATLGGAAIAPSAASSREPAKAARHMQPTSCPILPGTQLTNVEVYDGPFADRAILKPEESSARTGYWELGYIYQTGRTVNLRCSYGDGRTVDHELREPVRFCRYRDFADGHTALACR